jgi:hypothetical protein
MLWSSQGFDTEARKVATAVTFFCGKATLAFKVRRGVTLGMCVDAIGLSSELSRYEPRKMEDGSL